MYFVTTFHQMWRYRMLMREHMPFRNRPQKSLEPTEKSSEGSHAKAIEEIHGFQRFYHLERR
ncbi:MAG: hypothetical protein AAFU71_10625, partial [Cyanobacteria bacterium J06632_22]